MKEKLKNKKNLEIAGILILLLIFPLLLLIVRFSHDSRSNAAAPDKLETETGTLSSTGVTKQTDSGASGGSYVLFNKATPSNTPAPTSPPSTSGQIYGPGIAIDSKYNIRIGSPDYKKVSHRFRAKTTSRAESIAWELRTGSGYSLGDGGRLKISIQSDDGSNNHYPSGQILTSVEFVPGNGSGSKVRNLFPNPPLLTKGQLYHVVWENIASDPVNNYVSLNNVWTFATYTPNQPNPEFVGDYAVIVNGNNGAWGYKSDLYNRFTAQMDLAYEDGNHEGQAYSQAMWNQPGGSSDPEIIGIIEGQRQAREIFTVQGENKIVTAAYVRVAQEYGSGNLNIALKSSSGSILGQGTVPASSISDYADSNWYLALREDPGIAGDWVGVTFNSPITLTNGSTYQLVMTAPSGTKYAMVPIRYGTWDDVKLESYAFREGRAQQSNDGGNSWDNNYAYQPSVNYQFYLTLQ